jgi:hypothetical protein
MATKLTSPELRIAEAYTSVLDYVSRLALAVDKDDWFYLGDKAAEMEYRLQQLRDAAFDGHNATPEPRGAAVRAWVADRCRRAGFRAGELLHPVEDSAEHDAQIARDVAKALDGGGEGTEDA